MNMFMNITINYYSEETPKDTLFIGSPFAVPLFRGQWVPPLAIFDISCTTRDDSSSNSSSN